MRQVGRKAEFGTINNRRDQAGKGGRMNRKWTLWGIVAVVLVITLSTMTTLVLASSVSELEVDRLEVDREVLSSGLTAYVLGEVSESRPDKAITVDNSGFVHLSYASPGGVVYVKKMGSRWPMTDLSQLGRSFGYHSLAIDKQNKVHIAATGEMPGGMPGEDLVYFSNASGEWKFEGIDGDLSVGLNNDVVVDQEGNVHISYTDWRESRLKYATNSSGEWQVYVAAEKARAWSPTNIFVDSEEDIHIFYVFLSLIQLTKAGEAWTEKEIPDNIAASNYAIVMDKEDNIYVVSPYGDFFAYDAQAEVWERQRNVFPDIGRGKIGRNSLAIDRSGFLHLVYYARSWGIEEPGYIAYATNVTGEWEIEKIDDRPGPGTSGGIGPAIAVDEQDNFHLIYTLESDLKVRYITSQDDSTQIHRVWLPLVARNWCPPTIAFTYVPPYGSFENLQGRVECVEPADYKVAVYIFVSGWWTKPYWAEPLTTIRSDGSWTCDITTGGTDQLATKIIAFLVPNGYNPPKMSGGQTLPSDLYGNAVAYVETEREAVFRKIEFSGYTWKVKASETRAGPGPNYFSDREEDVWVDGEGRLHLRIVHRNGRWYCTEVFTEEPLGYGKYIFRLASRVDQLDKNIVLGLFTWDDTAPEHNYREIDIEFSRWGVEADNYAQYVVQPWDHPGNLYRFDMVLTEDNSTHGFDWQADQVFFQSLKGHQSFPGSAEDEIGVWTYTGSDAPPEGEGNARINLWLYSVSPPSDFENAEVVITAFEFHAQ